MPSFRNQLRTMFHRRGRPMVVPVLVSKDAEDRSRARTRSDQSRRSELLASDFGSADIVLGLLVVSAMLWGLLVA